MRDLGISVKRVTKPYFEDQWQVPHGLIYSQLFILDSNEAEAIKEELASQPRYMDTSGKHASIQSQGLSPGTFPFPLLEKAPIGVLDRFQHYGSHPNEWEISYSLEGKKDEEGLLLHGERSFRTDLSFKLEDSPEAQLLSVTPLIGYKFNPKGREKGELIGEIGRGAFYEILSRHLSSLALDLSIVSSKQGPLQNYVNFVPVEKNERVISLIEHVMDNVDHNDLRKFEVLEKEKEDIERGYRGEEVAIRCVRIATDALRKEYLFEMEKIVERIQKAPRLVRQERVA